MHRPSPRTLIAAVFLFVAIAHRTTAAIPQTERDALIALYDSTSGDGWTHKQNWKQPGGTECTWYGVTCDSGQTTVRTLNLSTNNLSGLLPPELGDLDNLTTLYLFGNQLTGPIPPELGNMSSLISLQLGQNQLSGSIPPELANLPKLADLNLYSNQLSGAIPLALAGVTSLRILSLATNQLTGTIPRELANLTNLSGLYLSENELSGTIPSELGSMIGLGSLSLGVNQLSGPIPVELANLVNLQGLDLDRNYLNGSIPPELGNLIKLNVLFLSNNELSGPIPSELGSLTRLLVLTLSSNHLSGELPSSLAALTRVASLDLSYNALFAFDSGVAAWAAARQSDWASTQTVAVRNVAIQSVSPTTATIRWTPIPYTANSGRYEVWADAGGGAFLAGSTTSKTATGVTLGGLTEATTYTFAVRTVTDPHSSNNNTVTSDPSLEVVATTIGAPSISIADATVAEGDSGNVTATFRVTLSAQSASTVTVQYATADGSAKDGADYIGVPPTTLTFSPGQVSNTVAVLVIGDLIEEAAEDFLVNLTNATEATIAGAQGSGTIVDNDGAQLSVSDSTLLEGDAGTTGTTVEIRLKSASASTVSVQWATTDGTATAGTDYESGGPATVTFAPGDTLRVVATQAIGDTSVEGNEIYYVALTAAVNATIGDGLGEVTIVDDDEPAASIPDPLIVVQGCTVVGGPCQLSAGSRSNGSATSWAREWKLDGAVKSTEAVWTPAFAQPGSYAVSLRVTNAAGGGEATTTLELTPSTPCPSGALCTNGGRFELLLAARDHRTGTTGPGVPLKKNDLFGYFALPALTGNSDNPEVFVKVLDGRALNGHYWVFYGGLTDLEYTLTLKDTVAGTTRSYTKPGGSSQGGFDVGGGVTGETCPNEVDGTLADPETPQPCGDGIDRLCLGGGRFKVALAASDHRTGATGAGLRIPENDLFGYFAIPGLTGNPDNPEVFVKMLDGRDVNGFFWLFYGGLTDLEYTLTITDTMTGVVKTYTKAPASACGAFDVSGF